MADTKLPKQIGKGNSSEFLSKSSSMGRALGDNRLADSGEYEPMNMINTPSATSNRIEEADIPFDVALAAYHAALEAQDNGVKRLEERRAGNECVSHCRFRCYALL